MGDIYGIWITTDEGQTWTREARIEGPNVTNLAWDHFSELSVDKRVKLVKNGGTVAYSHLEDDYQ